MAKKGLSYVAFAKLNETTGAYSEGVHLSPAAQFSFTPTKSDVRDYGDDHVVETDNSVTGGTISLELNNDDAEVYAYLLGATVTASGNDEGLVTSKTTDVAPYVGTGVIGPAQDKYICKVYVKTQYGEPNDEHSTKEENVTFNHLTLEGNMFALEDGTYRKRMEFDTLAEAKTWLNTLFGIS